MSVFTIRHHMPEVVETEGDSVEMHRVSLLHSGMTIMQAVRPTAAESLGDIEAWLREALDVVTDARRGA
jgi:hypothetical protein